MLKNHEVHFRQVLKQDYQNNYFVNNYLNLYKLNCILSLNLLIDDSFNLKYSHQ